MSPGVIVDTKGIEQAMANVEGGELAVQQFKDRAKRIVLTHMFLLAPKRRGRLAGSIRAKDTPDGFEVFPTVHYAPYQEHGTGFFTRTPHFIFPKKAKALVFEIEGKTIFARYTVGFPGKFFIKRTREETKERIFRLASDLWREWHSV